VALPAWVMLIYWMVIQIFGGLSQSVAEEGGGVAFWAHVGGFVAGAVLILPFLAGRGTDPPASPAVGRAW
jgi:membrane associated rhomboid family serine protease